jgi:putative aldouronate transport system permease protein
VIFCYVPMYGVLIAFKDYSPKLAFSTAIGPIPGISTCSSSFHLGGEPDLSNTTHSEPLLHRAGFPAPILFALLLNQLNGKC